MIKIKAISWIRSKTTTVYTDYLFDYIPILQSDYIIISCNQIISLILQPDYIIITIVYFHRSQHDYTI